MNSKIWILIIPFFSLCWSAFGQIELSSVDKNKLIASPGKVFTLAINIKNNSSEQLELEASIVGPASWRQIVVKKPIILAANQSELRLISFVVPANTYSGNYDFEYKVKAINPTQPIEEEKLALKINVPSFYGLSLEALSTPDFVLSGEKFEASFLVRNLSNRAQYVSFESYKCKLVGERRIYIKANGTKEIKVQSTANVNAFQVGRQSFRLEAWLSNNAQISKQAYQSVKIIPVAQSMEDDRFKIPAHIRLKYITRKNAKAEINSGFQGEFFSRGFLDEKKEKEVALKLRGPNQYELSILGLYDEYYAYYKTPKTSFFVGDKGYQLTPLTEASRYGRGIEADVSLKEFQLGAFYLKPRFFGDIKEEYASYIKYRSANNNQISFNLLRKTPTKESTVDYFVSALAKILPFKDTEVNFEYSKDLGAAKASSALFMGLYTQPLKFVRINANILQAGKNYNGYYTNTINYSGSLNLRVAKKVNLTFYARQDQRNAAIDTLYGLAPLAKRLRAGVVYYPTKKTTLKAFVNQHNIADQSPSQKFNYKISFFRFFVSQKIRRWKFTLSTDVGQTENYLLPPNDNLSYTLRGYFDADYKLSQKLQIKSYLNYLDQNKLTEAQIGEWIYGVNINSYLSANTHLQLRYQNNYSILEYYRDRSLFELDLNHKIGYHHELSLQGRYALLRGYLDRADYTFALEYKYRFGIATRKDKVTGSVKGQINVPKGSRHKGIILMLNGKTTTTDEFGNFEFKHVNPGTYFLLLDKSTLDLHQVPSLPTPIEVKVNSQQVTDISFSLLNAAKVFGAIHLQQKKNVQTLLGKEREKFEPVLISLTGEGESYKRMTNQNGEFEFNNLKPGKWKVKLISTNRNKNIIFEKEEFQFNLKESQQKKLTFIAKQKEKKIHYKQKTLHIKEK